MKNMFKKIPTEEHHYLFNDLGWTTFTEMRVSTKRCDEFLLKKRKRLNKRYLEKNIKDNTLYYVELPRKDLDSGKMYSREIVIAYKHGNEVLYHTLNGISVVDDFETVFCEFILNGTEVHEIFKVIEL